MRLTPRDRNLFQHLLRYGTLTTKQINSIVFDGVATTTVLRRLRNLEEEKFIKRLIALNSGELLWIMTAKAASEIEGGDYFKRSWNKNFLDHDFKLLCLRLHLEKHGLVKSWKPEHEIRHEVYKNFSPYAAKRQVISDGMMTAETPLKKVSVAVELELTLKNKKRLREILRRYTEKKNLDFIWYICGSMGLDDSIKREWVYISGHAEAKLHTSILSDVMRNPLAHFPAQGVSTLGSSPISAPRELSFEFHKRNSENYSPPISSSVTDSPPTTS